MDSIATRALFFITIMACALSNAAEVRHYIFFNRERERITEETFLSTKAISGAQLKYTWPELERQKDQYDFSAIEHDLAFLRSKGKKLFIQVQDASFDPTIVPIPRYLTNEAQFHGGADLQYNIKDDDEDHVTPQGWVARRWDPAVRERFHRLLIALGKRFDGEIEGINLPETAVDFGETGKLFPKDFSPDIYRDSIVSNMTVLKRAFPHSIAMQYANFMPGGQRYLAAIYRTAKELHVAMGGPDLLPYKLWQMKNCYPLIREVSRTIPTGIAVQDGNYDHHNPKTGKQVTIPELVDFATNYLHVSYLFWCTEEPYYSKKVIPLLREQK